MTMDDDDKDICNAIRDAALDQICAGLRRMGIPEAKITEARKLCVEQNSDRPLLDLVKGRRP